MGACSISALQCSRRLRVRSHAHRIDPLLYTPSTRGLQKHWIYREIRESSRQAQEQADADLHWLVLEGPLNTAHRTICLSIRSCIACSQRAHEHVGFPSGFLGDWQGVSCGARQAGLGSRKLQGHERLAMVTVRRCSAPTRWRGLHLACQGDRAPTTHVFRSSQACVTCYVCLPSSRLTLETHCFPRLCDAEYAVP